MKPANDERTQRILALVSESSGKRRKQYRRRWAKRPKGTR